MKMLKKNQKNVGSNFVPVGLDFLFTKGTPAVTVKIFWFPTKIWIRLSKKKKKNDWKTKVKKKLK